jgi:hypothetical protein
MEFKDLLFVWFILGPLALLTSFLVAIVIASACMAIGKGVSAMMGLL